MALFTHTGMYRFWSNVQVKCAVLPCGATPCHWKGAFSDFEAHLTKCQNIFPEVGEYVGQLQTLDPSRRSYMAKEQRMKRWEEELKKQQKELNNEREAMNATRKKIPICVPVKPTVSDK